MKYESLIGVSTILKAITYYERLGYRLIDVPQCVDIDVSNHTKPKDIPDLFHSDSKVYVGSAEQSFIQMYKDGVIAQGKHMALTPCYREEVDLDNTHYKMFLKLELISIGIKCSSEIANHALAFFKQHTPKTVEKIKTNEGIDTYDIMCQGVEIGSYGVRYMLDGTPYTYGTGIAEPRFSYVTGE